MERVVREPGLFLELRDGKLRLLHLADHVNQIRLPLCQLRVLPACTTVDHRIEPDRTIEILSLCEDTVYAVDLLLLPLVPPQDRIRLDHVQEHHRIASVRMRRKLDLRRKRNDDIIPLPTQVLPHRPADEHFRAFIDPVFGHGLGSAERPVEHPVILVHRVVNPAGEHPVEDLVVTGAFDLCHPPDTPFGDGVVHTFAVFRDRPMHIRFLETGCHAL